MLPMNRTLVSESITGKSGPDELHFQHLLDRASDAVLLLDPFHDRIIEANFRACSLLGYSHRELMEHLISDIHPDEMPKLRAFVDTVCRHHQGRTGQLHCLTKSGAALAAEISATVIANPDRPRLLAMVRPLHTGPESADRPIIVGESPPMRRIRTLIRKVAPTNATVLITGESGTGKELVARAIHEQSHRRLGPLIKVNCAAVPRELFESEFFGHVKGAYTGAHRDRSGRFELADGGTLFLDEVGEIPIELQGKLLGALQENCFERVGEGRPRRADVRIVAATNCDLPRQVAVGRFRRDLYYRLNVVPILVPALRERRTDIPLLARHLLERISGQYPGTTASLTADDLVRLHDHDWPGNVRELHNVIERALILGCSGQALQPTPDSPPGQVGDTRPYPACRHVVLTESQRRARDRDNILAALALAGGRIAGPGGAAELLELKPTTLRSRMKALRVVATEAGKIADTGHRSVSSGQ